MGISDLLLRNNIQFRYTHPVWLTLERFKYTIHCHLLFIFLRIYPAKKRNYYCATLIKSKSIRQIMFVIQVMIPATYIRK